MSAVVSHPRRIQFSNDEATWLHAAQSDDSSSLDSDPVLNIVINCIKNLEHEIIVKEPQNVPSENNLRAVLRQVWDSIEEFAKEHVGKKDWDERNLKALFYRQDIHCSGQRWVKAINVPDSAVSLRQRAMFFTHASLINSQILLNQKRKLYR